MLFYIDEYFKHSVLLNSTSLQFKNIYLIFRLYPGTGPFLYGYGYRSKIYCTQILYPGTGTGTAFLYPLRALPLLYVYVNLRSFSFWMIPYTTSFQHFFNIREYSRILISEYSLFGNHPNILFAAPLIFALLALSYVRRFKHI
jgi:hypothetical protein